jgi:DNA-binding beta-propeller fold protein YncE
MAFALAWLAACTPGLEDPTFPTGSTTIVALGRSLYAVNAFDGTLTRSDWGRDGKGLDLEMDLGGEPIRIAKVGKDELWVTLRGERSVAILSTTSTLPELTTRLKVGAEPYGIVATEDGSRVYVAVSQQDEVLEIDASSREVLRTFAVGDDPRWLALHPSERALFVSYAYPHPITRIDLRTGDQTEIHPPDTEIPPEDGSSEPPTDLVPRNTGDPAISPRGDLLVVPTLYVDPSTPGDQPVVSGADVRPPSVPYYTGATNGSGLQLSVTKFNPALVGVALDEHTGEPVPHEDVLAFFVGGFDRTGPVRGYVSSVTFDPNGVQVYATLESADTIAVVDLRPAKGQGMSASIVPGGVDSGSAKRVAPAEGGFWERGQVFVEAAGNPAGVAIDADGYRWVHERGNRKVAWFRTDDAVDLLDDLADGSAFPTRLHPAGRFGAGKSHLDPDVEAGRVLFYSADNPLVSAAGSGVSCSTCHFEGRNDGLTWAFDSDPRQTPSLAGPVGSTAPVTWTEQVPSVADEALITSVGRMGGRGVDPVAAQQIAAFIDASRDVDTARKGADDPQVRRGAALFAKPEVGCSECHNGPRYTDNGTHAIYDFDVNTPSLVGVAATAPYFHDGSADTLHDLLVRVRDGGMGSTAGLSDADLADLEAFLLTL